MIERPRAKPKPLYRFKPQKENNFDDRADAIKEGI